MTVAEGMTGEDGLFSVPDIEAGVYYLEETKAPAGYVLMSGMAELSIRRDDRTMKLVVSVETGNKTYTNEDGSGKVTVTEGGTQENGGEENSEEGTGKKNDIVTVTVENQPIPPYIPTDPTEKETQPQSGTESEDQTEPQSGTESEEQTEPQSETESEDQTEPQSGTESEPQTEPQSGTESEPQTEPQSGSETDLKPDTFSLTVTKRLEDLSGSAVAAVGRTYYVALFENKERSKRISEVKELQFDYSSGARVTFGNLSPGKTYYVGETDEKGVLLLSYTSDDEAYVADYPDGYAVQAKEGGQVVMFSFRNIFSKFPPEQFYHSGRLTVIKRTEADGNAYPTDQTFYAGVYSDAGCTVPVGDIICLDMAGGSEASVTVEVPVSVNDSDSHTYYIRETDEDGNVLAADSAGAGFTVSYDKESVTISWSHNTADVIITNTFPEEESEHVETEGNGTGSSTEKGGTPGSKAAKTADETPLGLLWLLLAVSVLMLIGAGNVSRRRSQK